MAKVYEQKNGAYVIFERSARWYHVTARDSAGELIDQIRCDDYQNARGYVRSFIALARNAK